VEVLRRCSGAAATVATASKDRYLRESRRVGRASAGALIAQRAGDDVPSPPRQTLEIRMEQLMSDSTIVIAARAQVSSDLGGEAVILQLASGTYYSLNEVGARIWELLQQPVSVGELRARIEEEYEVDADTCAADLRRLLAALAREGLVEISREHAA
jgi:hypothetical protein